MEKEYAAIYESAPTQKTVTTECSVEHTLPDYMPKIRRVLRVDARPIPTGSYREGGQGSFSGIVCYTVVYGDEEGGLSALSLNGDYSFTIPLGEEEVPVFHDTEAESTVCRLGGPRKLSLKTSLRSRVSAACRHPLPSPPCEDCERLTATARTRRTMVAEGGELTFSDGVELRGAVPDEVHPLFCEGTLLCEELRVTEGGVRLRGTVHVRVLLSQDGAAPSSVTTRVPIEKELVCEEANGTELACPACCVTSLNVRVTGNGEGGTRLEIDGTAECEVRLYRNEDIALTVGMYSPKCKTELSHAPLSYATLLGAASGNYTVSTAFSDAGEEPASLVLDTSSTAVLRKIVEEGGRPVALGEVKLRLLVAGTPGDEVSHTPCFAVEHSHPFRIELPINLPPPCEPFYEYRAEAVLSRARLEDGGFAVDTDVALSVAAFSEGHVSAVTDCRLLHEMPYPSQSGTITVVYPDDGDTLFSLAERYHKTPAELAEANHLPFESNEEAALPTSLDGVGFLLVE